MYNEREYPERPNWKIVLTILIISLAIGFCSMAGSLGIRVPDNVCTGTAQMSPELVPDNCIEGFGN